jgi:hypothetical protein
VEISDSVKVTACMWSINPIIQNPVYIHTYYVTISTFEGKTLSLELGRKLVHELPEQQL